MPNDGSNDPYSDGHSGSRRLNQHTPVEELSIMPPTDYSIRQTMRLNRDRLDTAYLLERRQVAGAVPNAFLNAREKAASEP